MFASKDIFLKSSGGYQISRSLRFRSSASGYLSKTFASSPASKTIQTFSYWIKRGSLSSTQFHWAGYDGTSAATTDALWNSSNQLQFEFGGSTTVALTTTQVFRDPAAWYHIVIAIDTTQATAANRIKLYANGSQITTFSTTNYPSQNALSQFALNNANNRIASAWTNATPLDGYMTEFNFIDGQALTPSSFGQTNSVTGVWEPIKYTGTYGTNGFYLNFSDNSNNTATTIGKDYSGNGNNWTPNNISVTAGVTYDSMTDVPTLTSATAANFAVFNPVNVSGGGTTTITNGNLATTVGSTTTFGKVLSSIGMSTGKWYCEVTIVAVGSGSNVGIGDGTPPSGSFGLGGVASELSYLSTGSKYTNNSVTAYGASYTTGDVIGAAYDADAGSITFYKNNTSQGAITGFSGTKFFAVGSSGGTSPQYAINFGQQPFVYTPPSGFKALNTQNLPTPTIGASTATQANKYFDATLYTGTGSVLTVTNAGGFQPDLVWVKSRSAATDNVLGNTQTTNGNILISNSTAAEAFSPGLYDIGYVGSVNGFKVQNFDGKTDTNAATYVAWQWRASNAAGVTNTSGSITSTVSANTTAGFSVVTYTGTAANATVGHGLGVAPSMIITKNRDSATAWWVYHTSLGNTQYLVLNTTAAAVTSSSAWNNTSPTSSVFSLGAANPSNANQDVAYCFAEVAGYSAFGSYAVNNSADGPFVYLGFRARWILFKNNGASTWNWMIVDTARDAINTVNSRLFPDLSNAESSTASPYLDITANGFKIRTTGGLFNTEGPVIYAAFAENPFKYSLAR